MMRQAKAKEKLTCIINFFTPKVAASFAAPHGKSAVPQQIYWHVIISSSCACFFFVTSVSLK